MSAIAWWLIPAVSVLVALFWVAWISRDRPREDPQDTMASHRRFQAAMERQPQLSPPRPPRPGRGDGTAQRRRPSHHS